MQINDPATLAEIWGCHHDYERALIANDAATLDSLFWDSPHSVRYGVSENLHGIEEIREFRRNRPNIDLSREIGNLEILSLGKFTGIVNLEFIRTMNGIERHGRQTQFWRKFPDGWKIVSAHVSLLPLASPYLDAVAAEIGLPIAASDRAAVGEDLKRLAGVAAFLLEFSLARSCEAAPVFEP